MNHHHELTVRALADALPHAVWLSARDGTVTYANRRWLEITGLSEDLAYGPEGWARVIHPDDFARVMAAWQANVAAGQAHEVELRLRSIAADPGSPASYRWFLTRAVPIRDATSGAVTMYVGTHTDIEDQKRAVELAEREQSFRDLAESVPQIVWTADASGWIDWYNHRWYDYTGQTPEEAAGWGWQAVHHPEDFPRVMEAWPGAIASGEPCEIEFRLRGKDGRFRWFLTRMMPQRDVGGRIVRWYGTNTDIDAQKRALERTQRVAQTLQDVFLPTQLPQPDGMRIDAAYRAAESEALVGGDWYDAFELPDGRLVVSIGDVAGHGLEASVTVGRMRQAIVTLAFDVHDPAVVLAKVNRILRSQEETLVTALIGFVDADRRAIRYASAGHPPPLLASPGAPPRFLPYGGLPLGVTRDVDLTTQTVPIEPDAVLALYTDGMTDFARNVDEAERALRDAVGQLVRNTAVGRPAVAVQQAVLGVRQPVDDAAVLILQFSRVDRTALAVDETALTKTWRFHSSDARTARTSRQELIAYVRRFAAHEEQVFAAELILGEILANTVEHAPGLVQIEIDWTGEKPVAIVRDTGPGLSRLSASLPTDVLNENGRGLFLIASLAEDVQVRPSPGYGTELRVVLPVTRERTVCELTS